MRPFISIQWNSWNSVSFSDSKFEYFQIFPNACLFFIFWYEKFLSINVKNVSLKKWCKNSYFLNWNFVRKSCFVVFFLEWNVWKNPQFNFSGQNLSLERNFFKWDGKVTKVWNLLLHRIWKNVFPPNLLDYSNWGNQWEISKFHFFLIIPIPKRTYQSNI